MLYSVPPVKALCGGHHVRESPTFLLVVPLRRVLAINPDQWRRPSNNRLSRHSGISSEGTGPASIAATVAISAGASSSIGATMLGKVADGIVDVRVLLLRSSTTHRCQLALAMKFTCQRHGNSSSICAYAVQTQSITRRKDLPFAHWTTHTHVHLVSCTNLTAHDSLHKSSGYIASHRRKRRTSKCVRSAIAFAFHLSFSSVQGTLNAFFDLVSRRGVDSNTHGVLPRKNSISNKPSQHPDRHSDFVFRSDHWKGCCTSDRHSSDELHLTLGHLQGVVYQQPKVRAKLRLCGHHELANSRAACLPWATASQEELSFAPHHTQELALSVGGSDKFRYFSDNPC